MYSTTLTTLYCSHTSSLNATVPGQKVWIARVWGRLISYFRPGTRVLYHCVRIEEGIALRLLILLRASCEQVTARLLAYQAGVEFSLALQPLVVKLSVPHISPHFLFSRDFMSTHITHTRPTKSAILPIQYFSV